MNTLTLYDHPLSGNCYKVRLLLALLGLEYRREHVDILAGESQTSAFRQVNPRGQVPVLRDGDTVVWDSMAILVYLARRFGANAWLPSAPEAEARVMQWLAVSENELLYGLARARAVKRLGRPFDLAQCQHDGRQGLDALEAQLAHTPWLTGEHATIADIACYPYVLLAPEGEVALEPYPAVQAWLERISQLPGWVAMDA